MKTVSRSHSVRVQHAIGCQNVFIGTPCILFGQAGGIAQYEVNHFLREAVSRGVAWADLQGFVDQVKVLPDKKVGLSWNLQRRCVDNARKHIRAFAAEMLAVVPCLVAFGDMVLAPSGEMAGHLACLRLLYELQVLLFLGSRAHLFVDLLGEVVAAHHDMYLALYPLCRKPKNHSSCTCPAWSLRSDEC